MESVTFSGAELAKWVGVDERDSISTVENLTFLKNGEYDVSCHAVGVAQIATLVARIILTKSAMNDSAEYNQKSALERVLQSFSNLVRMQKVFSGVELAPRDASEWLKPAVDSTSR